MEKTPKNKLTIIDEILKSDEDKIFTMSIADFKQFFTLAQLNRGWTKPQLEEIKARLKNG
jgi:hypothetical protein|tara:strand:+ start:248 stop:427 length:180 start_codon:yes stop_codon:yes gene_type:complete